MSGMRPRERSFDYLQRHFRPCRHRLGLSCWSEAAQFRSLRVLRLRRPMSFPAALPVRAKSITQHSARGTAPHTSSCVGVGLPAVLLCFRIQRTGVTSRSSRLEKSATRDSSSRLHKERLPPTARNLAAPSRPILDMRGSKTSSLRKHRPFFTVRADGGRDFKAWTDGHIPRQSARLALTTQRLPRALPSLRAPVRSRPSRNSSTSCSV